MSCLNLAIDMYPCFERKKTTTSYFTFTYKGSSPRNLSHDFSRHMYGGRYLKELAAEVAGLNSERTQGSEFKFEL